MKFLRIILALAFALPLFAQKEGLQRAVGTNTVTGSLTSAPFQVANIAALKAIAVSNSSTLTPNNTQVYVTGYYTTGDGAGGYFVYDASSVAPDDGGVTIAPTNGLGRWIRQVNWQSVDIKFFGAKCDSISDDSAAIQSASTYCATTGSTLFMGTGKTSVITSGVTIAVDVPVDLRGTISVSKGAGTPITGITIGNTSSGNGATIFINRINRATFSDWASESDIGVLLHNCRNASIDVSANNFTVGVKSLSTGGQGTSNNTFNFNRGLQDNKIAWLCDGVTGGYFNQNTIVNLKTNCTSASDGKGVRVGWRLTSSDASYTGHNGNCVMGMLCEIDGSGGGDTGTGFDCVYGMHNTIINMRGEQVAVAVAFSNGSSGNAIDITEISAPTITRNGYFNRVYRNETVFDFVAPCWQSGKLASFATQDTNGAVRIPGITGFPYNALTPALGSSNEWVIKDDYIYIERGFCYLGITIDTTICKRFAHFREIVAGGHGGRLGIRCYDSTGAPLTNAGGTLVFEERSGGSFSYSTNPGSFGGYWVEGTDNDTGQRFFSVASNVAKIDVMIAKGTNEVSLRSFSLASLDGGMPAISSAWDNCSVAARSRVCESNPICGYYSAPSIIYYSTHTPAGKIGMVLTSGNYSVRRAWSAGMTTVRWGEWASYLGNIYRSEGEGTAGTNPPVQTSGTVSDGLIDWTFIGTGTNAVWKDFGAIDP